MALCHQAKIKKVLLVISLIISMQHSYIFVLDEAKYDHFALEFYNITNLVQPIITEFRKR